jgi:hypothetical protein
VILSVFSRFTRAVISSFSRVVTSDVTKTRSIARIVLAAILGHHILRADIGRLDSLGAEQRIESNLPSPSLTPSKKPARRKGQFRTPYRIPFSSILDTTHSMCHLPRRAEGFRSIAAADWRGATQCTECIGVRLAKQASVQGLSSKPFLLL